MAFAKNGTDERMTRSEETEEEADDEAEEEADDEAEVEEVNGAEDGEDDLDEEDEQVIRITADVVDGRVRVTDEQVTPAPAQPLPSTSTSAPSTKKEEKSERETRDFVKLEAKEVYILMSKEYRISRNRRAEWFFNHVNTCLSFPPDEDELVEDEVEEEKIGGGASSSNSNGSSDFEVVSIIPLNPPKEWSFENRHEYRYHVNPSTVVTYLSRRYRIVFCLDISPSIASVDVQAGGVVFDNIFMALQACLHGLLQPFEVPGSKRIFGPEIFITVIAHTPFFTPVTDQVLIQGQILDSETCDQIIHLIFDRLNSIENKIARIVINGFDDDGESPHYYDYDDESASVHHDDSHVNFDETFLSNNVYSSLSMSPDFGLLDLLRQALIALSLMPENSSAGLVILTDGVISVPDGRYLDIILSQLRYNTVSCSFIQLSSPFHPHLCHGVLPYADLMKFIASATFGAYLSDAPDISDTGTVMNVYHMAFLAWSFQKTLETEWTKPGPPTHIKPGEWSVRNKCFFSVRDMPIVKKQQYENILHVDHMKVMSCRLREGFTIKEVVTSPETGLSEVTLILPWKFLIHLEYKILIGSLDFDDDISSPGGSSKVRCAVSLEGPYDFLHDVTCLAKKPFSSLYRQLMVNRFWATRKNLSESDRLLVHLNSFSSNPAFYNIPETLRNGVPLFYWTATSSATPQLHQSNELSIPQFTQFWKPVCLLDTTVWQKWMHTHRIGVILEHDYPLPKHMHLPNSTGRFNVIQCRQAVMALNNLLKSMSSFVLLENQSYVHLMFNEDDKVPYSFCLIRVTSKPPHVVLRLAFLVGTPGHLRHRTVATFREKIATLMFPQRVKDPPKWRVIMNPPSTTTASPLVNKTAWSEMPCCVIVQKPVEKILIRYDKSPEDFRRRLLSQDAIFTSYAEGKSTAPKQSTFGFRPTYQAPWGNASFQMLPEVFNTIARYLHHKRWIWWFPGGDLSPLNMKWASEILATVTKIRLQEGFRFAYSSAGITNMVLELPMKNSASKKNSVAPMVLQFVIFPPCSTLISDFEDFDSFDAHDSLYLITECWAEPQCGNVTEIENSPVVAPNFLELEYTDIPKQMFETDHKCISLVGTFEYLVRICNHKEAPFLISVNQSTTDKPVIGECESIDVIPFEFDLKQILMRSGQVEILFSSFYQDLSLTFPNEWNQSVCLFYERANSVLYQQWCGSVASLQDKEVQLSTEQHDAATRAVLQRKGIEEATETPRATPGTQKRPYIRREKHVQWRCFVRSTSTTHVILTLLPATLKDVKLLILQLGNMESIQKARCSRYVDFLNSGSCVPPEVVDVSTGTDSSLPPPPPPSLTSSQLSHSSLTCQNCQGGRKRVRAFSGGECAPATKRYLADPDCPHHQDSGSIASSSNLQVPLDSSSDPVRSQTFSEGTVSGKLAQFVRAKRAHSEQAAGTVGVEQDDNSSSSQINYFLHRSGSGGPPGSDESLRYVPWRTPIIGSLCLSLFTYSCSLLSLTDHVIFKKLSRDAMLKDFRLNKEDGIVGIVQEEFEGEEDDDDDSGSGTIFPNGRSISQESFSESSLQRLEMAEHELLLKSHCLQLRQAHLQSYIWSVYTSLLRGYPVNPFDIKTVIEKCSLSRVQFSLDNFLRYICRHEKQLEDEEADPSPCGCLKTIHQFIQKRFRRLLARNFSSVTENSHILFYKISHSNAFSDVSGLGMIKCSSDLEDNLDSCSIVADSLCSIDDHLPSSSVLHNVSDFELMEKSPAPPRSTTHTIMTQLESTGMQEDQQSCSMVTPSLTCSSAPLFSYLTCRFQGEPLLGGGDAAGINGFIPLVDVPTCYHDLCMAYVSSLVSSEEDEASKSEMKKSLTNVQLKLTMELTFLTLPIDRSRHDSKTEERERPVFSESEPEEKTASKEESGSSSTDKLVMTLDDFKKRLTIRQAIAIENIVNEIEWLMEDEITSFRASEPEINTDVLEKIAGHVDKSTGKPGCYHQKISLTFVEHNDNKGFASFLERLEKLSVNEYTFKQEGSWWYLQTTNSNPRRSQSDEEEEKESEQEENDENASPQSPPSSPALPPFWIILKTSVEQLHLYHHCRYDENDINVLTVSRNLRVQLIDTVSSLIRTINQDLLLQQLHDTRICSPLLEVDDQRDPQNFEMGVGVTVVEEVVSPVHESKFETESDISSTVATSILPNFLPGMFSCKVVWVTTFTLHSRLRSGGGKTAFARGIQTLRSTLTAFEVANRKNMFVYRDATGSVFYMRFYRGVDVLESPSKDGSSLLSGSNDTGEEYTDGNEEQFQIPVRIMRRKHNDSESEKSARDDVCDGILALKVHGIEAAGEEIKEQLVQSLRNKLDDAVLDILSVTLKRNPHCKLTPEDVHFLQEPRSKPDTVWKFALTTFVVEGHLPAFAYYLHQNLLQFLTMPKYTSAKTKYHFQDYSRLEDGIDSSVYLYNQSPGGGGTGNRGIAIVSMALTDRVGNLIKNPEWKQPEIGDEYDIEKFNEMIETREEEADVLVEFSMWKQGRINMDLLKSYVELAMKHAGWDLIMEYKVLTAPLSSAQEDEVFMEDSSCSVSIDGGIGTISSPPERLATGANVTERKADMRRRSSHLNPGMSRPSTGTALEDDDEPRTRSMSFTGLRKTTEDVSAAPAQANLDRAPSPMTLISGRGGSEGSRPRILVSRPQHQMSLTKTETGEVGNLHGNYTSLMDSWLDSGSQLGTPSLRRIVVPLNCRYPVKCIVQELEKIVGMVAPDNGARQFWKVTGYGGGLESTDSDYLCNAGGGYASRRSSGDDADTEYYTLKRHEKDLLSMEQTEEAEYPSKILGLFRRSENFQPGYKGHDCYLIARNFAHWKNCLNPDAEFALHTSHDFKNFYKYPPLLNENLDLEGSRGSIEKLPRANFCKEFVLWTTNREGKSSSFILIPRQRFLRCKITSSEVDFVVYNWSKECCERLQENVNQLSHWIQARASLLSSVLAQKSGLFYCQPILPDNFSSTLNGNPYMADVDLKDLILNTPPGKVAGFERRSTVGGRKPPPTSPPVKCTASWTKFYRNIPLCNLLGMPEPGGDISVDAHGRQLLHVLNAQVTPEPENPFFQYWLTRGPSASNVITAEVLESFTHAARTIHFCLTPIMFLPGWRGVVAQTRDSVSSGGIVRKHRGSSRRHYSGLSLRVHGPPPPAPPPSIASMVIGQSRVRHGSEASQASSLSLRNRSRSYHSGMTNLFLPELSEVGDDEGRVYVQAQQQQQLLLSKAKLEDPWHGVLCRLFLQEYMQYLQTLGFVPVHHKSGGAPNNNGGSGPGASGVVLGGGSTGGLNRTPSRGSPKRVLISGEGTKSTGTNSGIPQSPVLETRSITSGQSLGVNSSQTLGSNITLTNAGGTGEESSLEDDEMCHFLQRCLPGGIIVIEVGIHAPFFYCKIHALEAKRIFPKGPKNKAATAQNAVQFVDECEKMKIMTHLHSFMYDFHLRAMYLYISGRQLLFKGGYHITSFLDDFITYYPKCPNFSRNAVHIGMVTLQEVNTPSQVLFNYILGHDKYYRMKVIRMTPLNSTASTSNNGTNTSNASSSATNSAATATITPTTASASIKLFLTDFLADSVNEYVLVHNMSRKVSYRDREDDTQSDEFDLTLVIAHDYPTASRDFVPDYQGLRVKYYIVLTSRRELYPKGSGDNEPNNSGKLCPVNTPEPLCTRSLTCALMQQQQLLKQPPNTATSPASQLHLHHQLRDPFVLESGAVDNTFSFGTGSSIGIGSPNLQRGKSGGASTSTPFPDLIREEKVRYMGYFSSHEQMMQKIIDEQKDTMEQFIRTLITKAAVDCRRDLLWQRLLIGKQADTQKMAMMMKRSRTVKEVKEDIISRETVGPLYYLDFNELLELVQVLPLRKVDPRLEELLFQPVSFYQTLIKVITASGTGSMNPYNFREFVSSDHQIHQVAIFTPEAHKSIIMVEVNVEKASCDIYVVFKSQKKKGTSASSSSSSSEQYQQTENALMQQLFTSAEMGEAMYSLVEKVVNACCYTTWTTLI